MTAATATRKPPYQVPGMAHIRALPWNGYQVASTFSGCGGSSLGYRMAGFRVVYANEFIPEARRTYQANADPRTHLDDRDIRDVTPDDLLTRAGIAAGQLDLLDGSPPCASFSTLGKRQRNWGKVKAYSETTQRSDDLFFEFARILAGVQPKVFVAENVSGLIKGAAKGYFKDILRALKECGYRVGAKVLDASWLGVPQTRQRLIFQGVRADLPAQPAYPSPLPYRYTVRDALPHVIDVGTAPGHKEWVARVRVIHSATGDMHYAMGDVTDRPCPAIAVGHEGGASVLYQVTGSPLTSDPENGADLRINPALKVARGRTEIRRFTLAELRLVCGFPADFILTGSYGQGWERLGRAVPPVMMSHIAATIRDRVLACAG